MKSCIILKLNKILNWKPDYYNDIEELPKDMPKTLKDHIQQRSADGETLDVVWVSCECENPIDDNSLKNISYISLSGEQGFLGRYFPYKNLVGYKSPLVGVQFEAAHGELITIMLFILYSLDNLMNHIGNTSVNIKCRAWAKNIEIESNQGTYRFKISFKN